MVRIGIHQPNFIPWLPYFYKMAMCDYFIILDNVQFEKNGFQNRCMVNGKWWTIPVNRGLVSIIDKKTIYKQNLSVVNGKMIEALKFMLNIKTTIFSDGNVYAWENWASEKWEPPRYTNKTIRLVDLINRLKNHLDIKDDVFYVTNELAKDKYLDEELMHQNGIKIEYCKVPKNLQIHVFDAFNQHGIEWTINQLPNRKEHEAMQTVR